MENPGLWIRIHFFADSNPAIFSMLIRIQLHFNADPDPDLALKTVLKLKKRLFKSKQIYIKNINWSKFTLFFFK